MRTGAIAALLVVAILAGAGAGYFVGTTGQRAFTSVSTATYTTTKFTASTQSTESQTTSTSCIQTGIHGSLFVRVVTDNTSRPVSGDNVTVTILNYCDSEHRIPLGYTNSSGYASSSADWTGVLLVNVTNIFSKTSYTFLAQTSGAVSLATLSLPSGLIVIRPIACYEAFAATCSNVTVTSTAYEAG
jgi:hypothetical protein